MTVSSGTPDLTEYERVVADLVDELQQYKTAVTSLNDAVEASREIHARANAVTTMTETVLDRADRVFAELQQLDTPSLIPRLSSMEEAIARHSTGIDGLQDALASLTLAVREASRTSHETKDATKATNEAVLQATGKIVGTAEEAKASAETSRVQIAQLVESAVDASGEAKNASNASLEAVRTEIPSTITSTFEPLAAKVTRMTYMIYGLLVGNVVLLILILAFGL